MNLRLSLMVVLLLTTAPYVVSQESDFPATMEENGFTWSLMGDDPADDNNYQEGSAAEQDADRPGADLRALYVSENEGGDVRFKLIVTELPGSDDECTGPLCGYGYQVAFELWEYEMRIDIFQETSADGSASDSLRASMWLVHRTENSYRSEYLGQVPIETDSADNAFIATMPRDLVTDPSGNLLQAGTELHSFEAYSYFQDEAAFATFGLLQSRDFMPDEGVMPGTYETTYGVISSGHLETFSPLPLRTSNGEATTFFFQVEVTNTAEFFDTVHPEWSGGLESWTVTFPDGPVRLEPGETRSLPFLVTVPFSHEHGVYHPFTVAFQSQADPEAIGRLELGIRYTRVPQPAGHHPEVYLHEPDGRSFFNTIEDLTVIEESDESTDGSSNYCSNGRGQARAIPLSPSLSMGLDFELEEVGEATWVVTSEQDSDGYVYEGVFVVSAAEPDDCDYARGNVPQNVVAVIEATEPVTVSGGTTVEHTTVITPTEFGDYVPFNEQNQLWLMVRRTYEGTNTDDVICCPGDIGFEPQLAEGTSFFLPLNEYHDDVDDYFSELSGIDLYVANNTQERFVNPGETIIYRIQATNVGALESLFNLEITGTHTEWVQILGDVDEIKLKPGETRELAMAVSAPSGTSDGEIADIVLHATLDEDETIRSIIRLITEVDTDADHEDESALVGMVDEELKQSPVGLLPFLVAMLASLAMRVRRRMQ